MKVFFCKLRSNISLEGDIKLVERELLHFFSKIDIVTNFDVVSDKLGLDKEQIESNTRKLEPTGYLCSNNLFKIEHIAKQISFIQEIWFEISDVEKKTGIQNKPWSCVREFENQKFICVIPFMAAAEILNYVDLEQSVNSKTLQNLTEELAGISKKGNSKVKRAIKRLNTSTLHVHGLHKYKAKFFPRMTRSLIVSFLHDIPKNKLGKQILLDPFVGSGTALAEASLLELDCKGVDIDKLSCLISETKINILKNISIFDLERAFEQYTSEKYSNIFSDKNVIDYNFPPWIEKKFIRWNTIDEKEKYEFEIESILKCIQNIENARLKEVFRVCLSDALSRKFNIRMMGTGVGRFALEIGKKSLTSIFDSNLKKVRRMLSICQICSDTYNIQIAESDVICGSATELKIEDNSISIVFTSPPYLPASSGRENYLIGKSISITALELLTLEEIEEAEINSVGSMKANGNIDFENLPIKVRELYEWLKNDELRSIKATPTYMYYCMLRKALQETYRVLMPKGIAVFIIGKESVFYKYKTREILYKVKCDVIFKEIAKSCGFTIQEQIDVQLDKKNKNARPRSLDSYFETVFVLKKDVSSRST